MSTRRRAGGDVLVDELESNLHKFVRIEDIQDVYSSDGDDNSDEGYEELGPYGPEYLKKSSCVAPSDEEDNEPETALPLLFSEELPSSGSVPVSLPTFNYDNVSNPCYIIMTGTPDIFS